MTLMPPYSKFATLGAVSGALAVMVGAFGAHGLKSLQAAGEITARQLSAFETGASYHLTHAVLLTFIGCLSQGRFRTAAGVCVLIGMLLFSGSLYIYGVTGIPLFAMITPLGGVSYIAGWACLALYFWAQKSR